MFLRPFGLYCSAWFGILFLSIIYTCCSHFFWYCFISFTMFCVPVFSLMPVSNTMGWNCKQKKLKICQIILPSVLKNRTFYCRRENGKWKCHSRSWLLETSQQHAALFIRVVSVNEEVLTLMLPLWLNRKP